ncbi:PREDICTED: multiple organellar RNA editing factor 8, chloroplastic/mitochondrial-like [Camelina sativa]|uniref:Multiple organellar RNA editing factor 8, chloroplastic/mitochondrial-like n=1 Tax=Camelina sativa TaxID=90675 RepID=A0ABM0VZ59_CAMSA|nr:PREDICTED: multiple organellar RNA editing factor 8, chloroplastic/mitochondrial-like [Camelina sativa]
MATQTVSRSIVGRPAKSFALLFKRSFASSSPLANFPAASLSASTSLNRSRPLVAGFSTLLVRGGLFSARDLSRHATSSSLNGPNPNCSNRPPPEETNELEFDGCDYEHWLVVMDTPEGDLTRDEIIDSYIKTLAQVVGSEEEARMKIYSVSHRCYFAFGALVSQDVSLKINDLPKVKYVLPDSYMDVKKKDYGGEPFINGKAVPYDPKYHEEWMRNNARPGYGNRRNDSPRNWDSSRNLESRREKDRRIQDTATGHEWRMVWKLPAERWIPTARSGSHTRPIGINTRVK